MNMAVDMELKKAFQELSLQVVATREKVREIEGQHEATKRNTIRASITSQSLATLADPERTRTWESHGRIFVLRPREVLAAKLATAIAEGERRLKELEANKAYQLTKLAESEKNIREMVTAKQNASK